MAEFRTMESDMNIGLLRLGPRTLRSRRLAVGQLALGTSSKEGALMRRLLLTFTTLFCLRSLDRLRGRSGSGL